MFIACGKSTRVDTHKRQLGQCYGDYMLLGQLAEEVKN